MRITDATTLVNALLASQSMLFMLMPPKKGNDVARIVVTYEGGTAYVPDAPILLYVLAVECESAGGKSFNVRGRTNATPGNPSHNVKLFIRFR